MKIRTSFVSNSSSASFVLDESYLTSEQKLKIINYIEFAKEMNMEYIEYEWEVTVLENTIELSTWMDNFDMEEYLRIIGVADEAYIYKWHS